MSEELKRMICESKYMEKKNSITHGVLKMPQFGEVSFFYNIEYS